ncbi:hypothetical protein EB796_009122 [Bugula neritina]|uniref:Uncharacterized protein n=1 Tax=Bugula neritina TaxID=10212 RepID=A0A7J7K3G4_BUGNE|nr:hypothetical protein EB796_009122 [Bugula neritina]
MTVIKPTTTLTALLSIATSNEIIITLIKASKHPLLIPIMNTCVRMHGIRKYCSKAHNNGVTSFVEGIIRSLLYASEQFPSIHTTRNIAAGV